MPQQIWYSGQLRTRFQTPDPSIEPPPPPPSLSKGCPPPQGKQNRDMKYIITQGNKVQSY